jgi:HEAT repeat protein
MEQVLAKIYPEEPDYVNAAELGPEALPHLETIVMTADPMLAAKATSMASHIQHERSVSVLMSAARSKHELVRVTAAAGSRNLRIPSINGVLDLLKNDKDAGVRMQALKSVESLGSR